MKFGELKTLLKNYKSSKGDDLYTHLQEVFKKLILHYPTQAFDKLEEVSYLLRNAESHKIEDFLKVDDFRNYKDVCQEMDAFIEAMRYQFGAKKPLPEGEEEAEPEEIPPVGFVPDLVADA